MLADKFKTTFDALQAKAAKDQAARLDRDKVIQSKFPALDAAFSKLVDGATGSHPRLAVVKTPVTDTFTNRGFTTLDKTVIEIRSTLYGPLERVVCTPGLESVDPDQFGVIKVAAHDVQAKPGGGESAIRAKSILERGVLMRGTTEAQLCIAIGSNYEPLSSQAIEDFLEGLFIRT